MHFKYQTYGQLKSIPCWLNWTCTLLWIISSFAVLPYASCQLALVRLYCINRSIYTAHVSKCTDSYAYWKCLVSLNLAEITEAKLKDSWRFHYMNTTNFLTVPISIVFKFYVIMSKQSNICHFPSRSWKRCWSAIREISTPWPPATCKQRLLECSPIKSSWNPRQIQWPLRKNPWRSPSSQMWTMTSLKSEVVGFLLLMDS